MQRVFAGLFLAIACVSLHAQAMNMRATIPFAFRAGGKVLPAGDYNIQHSGDTLIIQNEDRNHSVLLITNSALRMNASAKSTLDFNRYGENYYLSTFWGGNSRSGCAVPKSRAEKEIAGRKGLRESVGVALRHQ
jgi:hypothetical protein